MTLILLFGLFFALLALEIPVAFAMGLAAMTVLWTLDINLMLVPQRLFTCINSFPLMAVPFFILAGMIMNKGGITKRIVSFAQVLVGHFYGGLAQVNIMASMLFAGISGSCSADAAAIGSMVIPAMRRDGYDANFSVAVTATSATIGAIIPPSITMIIYSSITNLSIASLFAAGIVPGVLIGFALMAVVRFYAPRRGYKKGTRASFSAILRRGKEAIWAIIAPIIIVGGILTGVFTATEAGVVAVVYCFLVSTVIYREMTWSGIKEVLEEAAVLTSIPMLILAFASIFGWVLAHQMFSQVVFGALSVFGQNEHLVMLAIIIMLLIIGLFVEGLAALLIFTPVLMPVGAMFGWDPVHLALIIIMTTLIGTTTPPVGLQLFIASAIGKIPVMKVTFIWPFAGAMVLIVLLVAYIPELATFIPNLLFA